MSKETIISIANRTGFSISTVSRVLSGKGKTYKISDRTIDKITREADLCGYTPSLTAKGLRMQKTNTIGVLVPSIDNSFFAHMASFIIRECQNYGYTAILAVSGENSTNEHELLRSLISRDVDGMIVASSDRSPDYLERINNHKPVVLIDRHFENTLLPYVCTNNYQGSFDATTHLIRNGHKKILCLQGLPHSMPSRERVRGYKDALEANGISGTAMVAGNEFSTQNGYLETKFALSYPERFTAIFALSNTILLGAIKAIREYGLSMPDDISLISFDNELYLDYMAPAISRVCQPVGEIAISAVKMLVNKLSGAHDRIDYPDGPVQIQLNPDFAIHDSVKNLR